MKFEIETNPFDDDKPLYRRRNIEIKPGLTVLVGCNGSGKTTLIHQIKEILQSKNIKYVHYDNLLDGGSEGASRAFYRGDTALGATIMCSSEGERITINMGTFAYKIGQLSKFCKEHCQKQLFVFIDASDSGMSIDNIENLKTGLFKTILSYNKDLETYIVVSANDYTMAKDEQCFDVYTGNYKTFSSYDEYHKFIMQSRNRKDKRSETYKEG